MDQLNLYDENSNTNGRAGALSGAKSASLPTVDGLATSPYGNTGGNYTGIVNDESKLLSPELLNLQGDGDYDSYRYWRCPSEGTDENYELVYRHIPACDLINPQAGGVDWLNFVFRLKNTKFNVDHVDKVLREILGIGIWKEQSRGMHHYDQTYILEDQKTLFMIGGKYQRETAMLSISG